MEFTNGDENHFKKKGFASWQNPNCMFSCVLLSFL